MTNRTDKSYLPILINAEDDKYLLRNEDDRIITVITHSVKNRDRDYK